MLSTVWTLWKRGRIQEFYKNYNIKTLISAPSYYKSPYNFMDWSHTDKFSEKLSKFMCNREWGSNFYKITVTDCKGIILKPSVNINKAKLRKLIIMILNWG